MRRALQAALSAELNDYYRLMAVLEQQAALPLPTPGALCIACFAPVFQCGPMLPLPTPSALGSFSYVARPALPIVLEIASCCCVLTLHCNPNTWRRLRRALRPLPHADPPVAVAGGADAAPQAAGGVVGLDSRHEGWRAGRCGALAAFCYYMCFWTC